MPYIDHKIYVYLLILASAIQFFLTGSHTAFEWTTTQDIPTLIRLSDPGFLKFDFYTNAIENAPRFAFLYSIYSLQVFGLDWYSSLYLVKIIFTLSIKPALFLASYKLINSWTTVTTHYKVEYVKLFLFLLIATSVSTLFFKEPAGWSAIEKYRFLSPMTLSAVFGLLYISLSLNKSAFNWQSMTVLFVTTLLHPVVGLSLFSVKLIFIPPPNYKSQINTSLITFLFGVILPIIILKLSYSTTTSLTAEEFIYHYVFLRHPHHYDMSAVISWNFISWLALFILPFIYATYKGNKNLIILSILCFLFFTIPVLLQYTGVSLLPSKYIAQLGPSRFSIFAPLVWFSEIFIFILAISKTGTRFPEILEKKKILNVQLTNSINKTYFWFLFVGLVLIVWSTTNKNPIEKANSETKKILTWIKFYTPVDAIILVPLNTFDTFMIRAYSERSIFSDEAFPFNESYMIEFSERLGVIKKFKSLTINDFACLHRNQILTHILINKNEVGKFRSYTAEYKTANYFIYNTENFILKNNSCDIKKFTHIY